MYNIIALIGEAGSGKDRIMKEVLASNPSLHEIISCTSRPMREGEVNGVNYFYYTRQEFEDKYFNGEMLESCVFNNWFYGTSYDSVKKDCINIGVFNPEGIKSLIRRKDCNLCVFWIRTDDKTRLLRQLNREEHPDVEEIIRRYSTDKKDFFDLENELPISIINLRNDRFEDIEANVEAIMRSSEAFFT